MKRQSWVEGLTEEQLTELLGPGSPVLRAMRDRLREIVRTTYFRPLAEEAEVIELLRTRAVGRPYATDEDARQRFIEGARRFGDSQKVAPVFYHVRAGYRGDFHPPMHGPCHGWPAAADLRRNPPTPHAVTFFLPSEQDLWWRNETVRQQRELLRRHAEKSGLAPHLVRGFPTLAMLAGHVLAHYVATNVRLLSGTVVRTSTYRADNGMRLLLGRFYVSRFKRDSGLRCGGGGRNSDFRWLVLGVQKLDPEPAQV